MNLAVSLKYNETQKVCVSYVLVEREFHIAEA